MKKPQNLLEECKDKKNLSHINNLYWFGGRISLWDVCFIFKALSNFKTIIFYLFGTKRIDFEQRSVEQHI